MNLELGEAERAALIEELRRTVATDLFPLPPRIQRLRAILAKLEPQPARPETYPAPKPASEPSHVLAKRKRPRR